MNIRASIATELNISLEQVSTVIELLNGGATVPFISRYRKEVTGGLTDTQLRLFEERLYYLRELDDRRTIILKSITEQNKLTPELEKSILEATNKASLEDLYLPYKPKRRTKAQIAREAGLEPLANSILEHPHQDMNQSAIPFISEERGINTVKDALDGARHILMEQFSENSNLLSRLRNFLWEHGIVKSNVIKGKENEGNKFSDYFNYQELIKKIPSHRALAFLRGQREEILHVSLTLTDEEISICLQKMQDTFGIQQQHTWLCETINLTWRIKLFIKLELELIMLLREKAEEEAIRVFANNLRHLLMTSPAGSRVTLALDPGLRTGVKVVIIDGTGKLLMHTSIFPHAPRHEWDHSLAVLAKLCKTYHVELVSIGNGTASRETDKLVSELRKKHPELKLTCIVISEAGASVYSASELASKEFPELDVSYRGAVSIGRRLQDPLAELVKIDPKSIGVGQYQHDVNQVKLSRSLHSVMEDCVNSVGVDVNTASAPLLSCVAGINETIAQNIIKFRDEHGAFKNRSQLKKVSRLGDKAFEQSAGFLRIMNADNPLDTSAVHPEAYAIVEKILVKNNKSLKDMMGNIAMLRSLNPRDYTDHIFGLPTVTDIIKELEKPGRDPRPEFKTATFQEGIETISDLKAGMILEGVVTNVANFGVFVDIGVHQDGLVHISMLSDQRIHNPHDFIKIGAIVKVKVLEVDLQRKRIQLTMKINTEKSAPRQHKRVVQPNNTALGNALLKAMEKK